MRKLACKEEKLKTFQKEGQQNYQLLWSFFLGMFPDKD